MVISMDRWRGKVAVVTGASAGIGEAIANKLVEEGVQVVGFSRRYQRVEENAINLRGRKGKLFSVQVDLTKEEDVIRGFKWVADHLGGVHILINNAGVIQQTSLTDGNTEKWKRVLDTNVLGLCIATREAVKIMKASKIDGHIIHINSLAGHIVPNSPGLNVYPASKHAVTALTETLRQELNQLGLKIKITSLSPSGVETELVKNNSFQLSAELVKAMKKAPMLQTEDIADSIIYILSTPPHVQVHELIIRPIGDLPIKF